MDDLQDLLSVGSLGNAMVLFLGATTSHELPQPYMAHVFPFADPLGKLRGWLTVSTPWDRLVVVSGIPRE